ncbi:unnamed protein product [Mytilus coruscus]|uniref:Uncharacterized protein n=1 Tax=Mytilus coruscus TaxID=42192 RepID=A0A6J8BPM6_MYTCO|nr:unnamed protein product [Mytilus coruscus]
MEALKRKGIICSPNTKKANQCREKIIEYFKEKIKEKKSNKRKYLATIKVMKKYKLSRRTSLLLDVQPSDISRCREDDAIRATRSDALASDVKISFINSCINRECNDCQTDLFMAHLQPLLQDYGNQIVEYTRWETSKFRNKHGKDVSRVMMVKHKKRLQDIVFETMEELSKLSRHLFNARWQQLQFSTIIKDIPVNWVILNLDFAENYACVSQMEIQTAHWYHQQVTIHPIVAYYKVNCHQCQETVQETMLFISDDLTHDAHAVHKFVSMANEHLQQKRMINIQHEIQFSDGCSSQYKSFTPFCDISYSLQDYGFIIERHFYGSRHGKGPCDGAGAVLKSAARRAVMGQTQVINNSKDLFEFAKLKLVKDDLPNSDEHLHSKRTVFHVTESDICRNRPDRIAKTLKGTRLLHSIKTKEGMNIYTRTQSCFCQPCREGIGQCQNDEYVENWKEEHLYRRGENRPRVRQIRNVGEVIRGERGRTRNRGDKEEEEEEYKMMGPEYTMVQEYQELEVGKLYANGRIINQIYIGSVQGSNILLDRTILIKFNTHEANVPDIIAKFPDAVYEEQEDIEDFVLTDTKGNQILDSEATRGNI